MTAPLQTRFEQIASAFPLHAQRIALRTALAMLPGPRGWLVLLLLALGAASVLAGGV